MNHITPTRLVDLDISILGENMGKLLTTDDVRALITTVRAYWSLTHNLAELSERGAVVVLASGDEVELNPAAIDRHLTNEAESAEMAANEAYYGGDGPPGCYGPDDTRGQR